MSGRALRMLIDLTARVLPAERREWVEALGAEAASVPAGWRRLFWLLGSFAVLAKEVGRMRATQLRVAMVGALAAVAVLAAVVRWRYPEVASGAGTAIYGTLLVLVLAGYTVATLRLSRAGPRLVGYAMVAGLAGAVLWTLGTPAGGFYHLSSPALAALYAIGLVVAFAVAPVSAAALMVRRTGQLEEGVLTGAVTGMYAALANLVGGLFLVLVAPGHVPFDSDVLRRHHTPAAILGANVGEDLVVFIALLVAWPLAGLVLGAIGGALGPVLPGRATPTGQPRPGPAAG